MGGALSARHCHRTSALAHRLCCPRQPQSQIAFLHQRAHLPYLIQNGEWSARAHARREVLAREKTTGYPTQVLITGQHLPGRELHAEGRRFSEPSVPLKPERLSINCLTQWSINGVTAFGEDHENWIPAAARNFFRRELGLRSP